MKAKAICKYEACATGIELSSKGFHYFPIGYLDELKIPKCSVSDEVGERGAGWACGGRGGWRQPPLGGRQLRIRQQSNPRGEAAAPTRFSC